MFETERKHREERVQSERDNGEREGSAPLPFSVITRAFLFLQNLPYFGRRLRLR